MKNKSTTKNPLLNLMSRSHSIFGFRHSKLQAWLIGLILALTTFTGISYAVAALYQHSQSGKPYKTGVTFIPFYAESLGLDSKETMDAIIDDLGVRQFRLVSYWDDIEKQKGIYDFSSLDWQFERAEKSGSTISLSMGLRQPRWPECHAPKFYDTSKPRTQWQPELENYMSAVVNRYKNSPSLKSYQLENEFFNHFGECYNFDRQRLSDELALLKRLDPKHPIIISRSNNYAGFAIRPPRGDVNGISLYRRVWDTSVTKRYFTYPFPSWHYAGLAGVQKFLFGQESIIHELQTEPWPPDGKNITEISLTEQNKSFDAARFRSTTKFAHQTGIRHVDLWGAEYWYYRKTILQEPSVWDEAKKYFHHASYD